MAEPFSDEGVLLWLVMTDETEGTVEQEERGNSQLAAAAATAFDSCWNSCDCWTRFIWSCSAVDDDKSDKELTEVAVGED